MRAGQRGWLVEAALAGLLVYAGIVLLLQAGIVADGAYIHEELRLLFRYHQAADPELFAGDYLASYVSALSQPLLYDWMTRLWVQAGGALDLFHRLVPLACWFAFLAGIVLAARGLGDRLTMVGALGIAVAQPLYLYQITSAVPHAFAFPLLIWAFFALLRGSAPGLAAVTLLAGLLYPAVAPLTGLLLAWHLLFGARVLTASNTVRFKSLALLAVTGGVTLWLVSESLRSPADFGAPLAPLQKADVYPENGPGGRYSEIVFNPLTYVAGRAFLQFRDVFDSYKLLLLFAYAAFALYGVVALMKQDKSRGAVTAFLVCSAALFILVLALRPYLLYRFLLYPLLSIAPLLLAVGLQQFCRRLGGEGGRASLAAVAAFAVLVAALDSLNSKKLGYWTRLGPEQTQVIGFAAAQPRETLFATWPSGESEFEFIPYFARRPLFMMIKAHYPSHEDHVVEMRARTDALIDAYLAVGLEPLVQLYCLWQVDYLIVDKVQYRPGAEAPVYFAPFDTRLAVLWETHGVEDFVLHQPDPAAVALDTGRYQVVRLQTFAEAAQGAAAADCRSS